MTRRKPHRRRREIARIEWDSSREWPPRWVRRLLRAVIEDYQQEKFSIDFHDKLAKRGLVLQNALETVRSRQSYIAKFRHEDGVNRVGFWNPRTRLFVVWKPRKGKSESRYMTCFELKNGIRYMRRQEKFREIRKGNVR